MCRDADGYGFERRGRDLAGGHCGLPGDCRKGGGAPAGAGIFRGMTAAAKQRLPKIISGVFCADGAGNPGLGYFLWVG